MKEILLNFSSFETPLGTMVAVADERALYLLEFAERQHLEREMERLRKRTKATLLPGFSPPLLSIEKELALYFKGELTQFKTPLHLSGSPFQKKVWEALLKIPLGQTRSYLELAMSIGRPSASRAVGRANGSNQHALIIPCHRVINSNGELGGYAGGLTRKQWLLDHEKRRAFS